MLAKILADMSLMDEAPNGLRSRSTLHGVCPYGNGWGEKGLKTDCHAVACYSSESTPKNAPSPSRPALFA
jgi:hypothetical protein